MIDMENSTDEWESTSVEDDALGNFSTTFFFMQYRKQIRAGKQFSFKLKSPCFSFKTADYNT